MGRPVSGGGAPRALHTQILAGLAGGALAGVFANRLWRGAPGLEWVVDHLTQPVGQTFLRLLFMVVVPLVFTSLVLGVTDLGDLSKLGRTSARTFGLFLMTTVVAGALGLVRVNAIAPGRAIEASVRAGLMDQFAGQVPRHDAHDRLDAEACARRPRSSSYR